MFITNICYTFDCSLLLLQDDGVECTSDYCDEYHGNCQYVTNNDNINCPKCLGAACTPQCPDNALCGSDHCGNKCGTCAQGYGCNNFTCISETTVVGTCLQPIQLFDHNDNVLGVRKYSMNLLYGLDVVTPTCFNDGTAKDLIFTFTTPHNITNLAIDVRTVATGDISNNLVDTIIELREGSCYDGNEQAIMQPMNQFCNDEYIPPGNFGSRISGFLKPNTQYYLIITQYPHYACMLYINSNQVI